ncbi:hypothetical protein QTJ16_006078 [Diplocarpon rosae]|uniref:Uncharacterized protein n=1 Tax=Diplocarpon rosae TaxID=946125 RepID=A0AAD9WB33_9HELO|nr:hypothetical protein QTJ16_006078 [Diplocarpon rosae]
MAPTLPHPEQRMDLGRLEHVVSRPTSSSTSTAAAPISSPPACEHIYTPQTLIAPLPPIYSSLAPALRPATVTQLARALHDLGTPRAHPALRSRDIVQLRGELEQGMSSERRRCVQLYVRGLADERRRAATELWLARYKGFRMGSHGRLDFGLGEMKTPDGSRSSGLDARESAQREELGRGRCGVM